MARILVADDDASLCRSLAAILGDDGHEVVTVAGGKPALAHIERTPPDLAVLDHSMPDLDGVAVLEAAKPRLRAIPVLFMTGLGSENAAIRAIQLGAFDVLLKPFSSDQMRDLVRRALASTRSRPTAPAAAEAVARTASPQMLEVYKKVGRLAATDVTVLLRGESGTGKEVLARLIHQHSLRAAAPFVAVNCAAIPETLLESELFGAEAEAYTGATARRVGKIEQAHKGTLFLDEVGDMSPQTQAKALRVLQHHSFERLGGNKTVSVDVRILAATHRNLEQMVADGTFRADLLYRLNVVSIEMPALRERREDIPILAELFLARFGRSLGKSAPIRDDAMESLRAAPWPGNIRELEHCLQRALVLDNDGEIGCDDLVLSDAAAAAASGDDGFLAQAERALNEDAGHAWARFVKRAERSLIQRALRRCGNNLSKTADLLGISRPTLRAKCRRLGLLDRTNGQG